ncbi:MAG: stalk domain-containing protein [Bacillota bacterium]|nr:stalk domain-containing protein [Bacillota bacterium]
MKKILALVLACSMVFATAFCIFNISAAYALDEIEFSSSWQTSVTSELGNLGLAAPAAAAPVAAAPAEQAGSKAPSKAPVGAEMSAGSSWKYTASSSNDQVGKLFDGDTNTIWHSHYTAEGSKVTSHDAPPYTITVSFGKVTEFSGVSYYPRPSGTTGTWKVVTYYGSSDGKSYTELATDTYTFASATDKAPKTTSFGNVKYKFFKAVITQGESGFGTGSELRFHEAVKVAAPQQRERTTTTADTTPGAGKITLTINSTSATSDGSTQTLLAAPVIQGGATMIPAKFVAEALGGSYSENGSDITMVVGSATLNLETDTTYLTVSGIRTCLASPTFSLNGTVMISVKVLTDALGANVSWNQAQQTIVITK